MRRLRRVRSSGRRGADGARPARSPASRPGGGRHRLLRRRDVPCRAACRPRRRHVHASPRGQRSRRRPRHRPQSLLDPRRIDRAQHPAAVRPVLRRRFRRRAQRQPDQRHCPAGRVPAARLDFPVDLRHGGDPSPHRHLRPQSPCRPDRRCPAEDRGGLVAGLPVDQEDDRLPRSSRRAAARSRRIRRGDRPRLGDMCARHHRGAFRPRCRTRRDGHGDRGRDREPVSLRSGEIAVLHLRIRLFRPSRLLGRGPRCLRSAQADRGAACQAKSRPKPTWSYRCPIPARRRRSATHWPPACPSISASSATTMSDAHSSNRRTRSVTWAYVSSTTPIATYSPASGWCSSTIQSCAAPPRRRSSR